MADYGNLIQQIYIPPEQRKATTLARAIFYEVIGIYDNKVIAYADGQQKMTWFFKDYSGIDVVFANMNSQFAQVVFLTGFNAKNRVVGVDLFGAQNLNAMQDTNRILFCSGMFSFARTNDFANYVGAQIRAAFNQYKENDSVEVEVTSSVSAADEIRKFKELMDAGIITEEEFELKKKQLLGL